VYANEVAESVLTDAVPIFDANGCMQDHPVETMYRRVRSWMIAAGTIEIHRNGIARTLYDKGYC
jgi:alkylation response protein AidB-like acyl-CoA dehydrogenase